MCLEYRLKRADGLYRWIFDRGAPFYQGGGAFAGYIGSCIDVTDRVEAQAALMRRRIARTGATSGASPHLFVLPQSPR